MFSSFFPFVGVIFVEVQLKVITLQGKAIPDNTILLTNYQPLVQKKMSLHHRYNYPLHGVDLDKCKNMGVSSFEQFH